MSVGFIFCSGKSESPYFNFDGDRNQKQQEKFSHVNNLSALDTTTDEARQDASKGGVARNNTNLKELSNFASLGGLTFESTTRHKKQQLAIKMLMSDLTYIPKESQKI
jgi:hypothetical protein